MDSFVPNILDSVATLLVLDMDTEGCVARLVTLFNIEYLPGEMRTVISVVMGLDEFLFI